MVESKKSLQATAGSKLESETEIKTALQVAIFGREQSAGTTFYVIRTWLIYQPGEISGPLQKRYSQFFELHEALERMGYENLPQLPRKKFYMSERDTDDRQRGLESYLKELVNRKDTRNSLPVVEFLNLHEVCPEVMYNVPQLLIKREF